MTDREQLRRDLEAFGYLAPTLGQHAQRETPLDIVVGVDPTFAARVQASIDNAGVWWFDGPAAMLPPRRPFISPDLLKVASDANRSRRRAARARKARRG